MPINHGRDKSGRPPWSRPKIKIGIFNPPGESILLGSGSRDLHEKSDFRSDFSRLFKTNKDKSRKSRNVEISRLIPTYLDLSWLIPTYPNLSRIIRTFPSTNLGYYSQKSRQYRLSRYSERWEKSGNQEKLRQSRLYPISWFIPTCLKLSRLKTRLSRPDPNFY